MSVILTLLEAGLVSGWDLGQGAWAPALSALALILATSGGGRRALLAGLGHALGGLLGLALLFAALSRDSAGASELLNDISVHRAGAVMVALAALLLAGLALRARRRGDPPSDRVLGLAACSIGLGGLLLCSASAQLFTMLGNVALGDSAAMAVSMVSAATGLLLGPVPVIGYLGGALLGRAAVSWAPTARLILVLAGALFGLVGLVI